MNVVIFSKDRACQLDALLRSYALHNKSFDSCATTVIYKASNLEFGIGYELVKQTWDKSTNIKFVEEQHFEKDVLAAIDPIQQFTMFLVDDIVFKDDFSLNDPQFKALEQVQTNLCLSLRLWKGVNYCYPTNSASRAPELFEDGSFYWQGAEGDWGYPMSLDGNVFRTFFIKMFLERFQYTNPNSMEGMLAMYAWMFSNFPKMLCYPDGSRLLNIPANRVQETALNRHESSISPEELNNRFLGGEVIDITPFKKFPNNSPHIALPYSLKKL